MAPHSFCMIVRAVPALLILGLGCSRPATSPVTNVENLTAQSRSDGLVDLVLDRVTRVDGVSRFRIVPTGGVPEDWAEYPIHIELRIVGTETPIPGGSEYVVEESTDPTDGSPYQPNSLWRQDRSGLFLFQEDLAPIPPELIARTKLGLDANTADAVDRAIARIAAKRAALHAGGDDPVLLPQLWGASTAGGVGPHEITFLRYPLHPGATWVGRPDFNVWTVEALETVVSPAGRFYAGRMRIDLPKFFGPNDSAHTWWGMPGEVKRYYHLVSEATSPTGEALGLVEYEESFLITAYSQRPTS
jgi:hypothetical protein